MKYNIRLSRIKKIPEGEYEGIFKGKPCAILISRKNKYKRKVCYFNVKGSFENYHISGRSKSFGYDMQVFLFSNSGISLTGDIQIGDLYIINKK